jgi:hypothetical protein
MLRHKIFSTFFIFALFLLTACPKNQPGVIATRPFSLFPTSSDPTPSVSEPELISAFELKAAGYDSYTQSVGLAIKRISGKTNSCELSEGHPLFRKDGPWKELPILIHPKSDSSKLPSDKFLKMMTFIPVSSSKQELQFVLRFKTSEIEMGGLFKFIPVFYKVEEQNLCKVDTLICVKYERFGKDYSCKNWQRLNEIAAEISVQLTSLSYEIKGFVLKLQELTNQENKEIKITKENFKDKTTITD